MYWVCQDLVNMHMHDVAGSEAERSASCMGKTPWMTNVPYLKMIMYRARRQDMEFPYTYFEDEVRDGFYVSGMMKRAWAAQLEILEDIRKVCEKYQIKYFAEWGTLLGAVRHRGFIPWDDDMDICMKREDYIRFLAVAEKELPDGYRLMSFRSDQNFWEMLTRVLNAKQICFEAGHLKKFHNFPFIAGIDIFPLDYLSKQEQEEELRDHLIHVIASTADYAGSAVVERHMLEKKLCQVEEFCGIKIDRKKEIKKQLYLLMDQMFSLYKEEESEYITMMPLWLKDGYRFPKSYYHETILLPFENTKIPVPAAYDTILRKKYGDYMKPIHNWDSHDYPFYKSQAEHLMQYGVNTFQYAFSTDDLRKEKCDMNQTAKKKAERNIALLKKAHGEILRAVACGETSEAADLLVKCQSSAISLGTMLENCADDAAAVVGYLERYCEFVYQIHEELRNGDVLNLVKIDKDLQEQMECVALYLKNEMKVRKEVVFLPYKASMWDSLESVWKAAEEDPDCVAYVIPIPYYDKNMDGSFCQMHDERDQYPDYVPITKYEDYDFEARHPEIIFIHNPYDECNFATSVHPFFYSKNLKKFTDKLVYIPYFVLDELNPLDQRAILSMQHFVTVPGVVHADCVVVQSENMRKQYIEALTQFAGVNTRDIWEKKILGLGSPKFDRMRNVNQEKQKVPDEWMKIIQKPDGNKKKVVFYNTGISALLEHNEKLLEKIKDVLHVFRENQDYVTLLWRPHPLMDTIIKTMRPQLREEYQKFVKKYRNEKWGIYDDTVDLDRAMKLSDAYYGDGSSVAILYQKMNKPLIFQSVNVRYGGKMQEDFIWSYNFVADGQDIWFVPYYYNRLCRYHCGENKITLLKQLPVKNEIEGLYVNLCKVNHYFILLPYRANDICIYDSLMDTFQMIPLKESNQLNKFGISAVWNDWVYLFPFAYPAICKVNMKTGTVDYLTSWLDEISEKNYYFRWDYHVENNFVYLILAQTNQIYRFDMANDTYAFIAVGDVSESYTSIHFESEKEIYLCNQNGDIIIYNHKSSKTTKIRNNLKDFKFFYKNPSEGCFICSICLGDSIYFIPGQADRMVSFHKRTHEIRECQDLMSFMIKGNRNLNFYDSRFSVIQQNDALLRGFNLFEQYFFEINTKTGERNYYFIPLSQDLILETAESRKFEPLLFANDQRHIESTSFHYNLYALLDLLKKDNVQQPSDIALCGMKIYELLNKKEC